MDCQMRLVVDRSVFVRRRANEMSTENVSMKDEGRALLSLHYPKVMLYRTLRKNSRHVFYEGSGEKRLVFALNNDYLVVKEKESDVHLVLKLKPHGVERAIGLLNQLGKVGNNSEVCLWHVINADQKVMEIINSVAKSKYDDNHIDESSHDGVEDDDDHDLATQEREAMLSEVWKKPSNDQILHWSTIHELRSHLASIKSDPDYALKLDEMRSAFSVQSETSPQAEALTKTVQELVKNNRTVMEQIYKALNSSS